MGTQCECINKARHKDYDKHSRNKTSASFYNSTEWHKAKEKAMKMYAGIDVYELYKYGRLMYGTLVHHIRPIKHNYELRIDINNLVVLTDKSHSEVHRRMDNGEYEAVIMELQGYCNRFKRDFM